MSIAAGVAAVVSGLVDPRFSREGKRRAPNLGSETSVEFRSSLG